MNITEANAVAQLVHALDGTAREDQTTPELMVAVDFLIERAGKALDLTLRVDRDSLEDFLDITRREVP